MEIIQTNTPTDKETNKTIKLKANEQNNQTKSKQTKEQAKQTNLHVQVHIIHNLMLKVFVCF